MYFDETYLIVIIGAVISMFFSARMQSTFKKFSQVQNCRRLTGVDVAERILQNAGIYDVQVELIEGNLTDHYSPNEKVLRLSESVYYSSSIAAVGVAAHECGHAIQHAQGYSLVRLRNTIVPVVNFGSQASIPLFLIGLFVGFEPLVTIGLILFSFALVFQLVTLPVELDASSRAMRILRDDRFLEEDELRMSRKVLSAAAMTYVAAVAVSALQLLRLILIARRRND